MTTDLSPSGIQRLLEICAAYPADPWRMVAKTALPDALRELSALGENVDSLGNEIVALRTELNARDVSVSASRERIAALEEMLEHTGCMADICVGPTIGRRCRYCECDGKNLAGAVLSEGVGK
jgi:hypothetical protein